MSSKSSPSALRFGKIVPSSRISKISSYFPCGLRLSKNFLISWFVVAFTSATVFAHFPIPPKKGDIGRRVVEKPVRNITLIDQSGKKFSLDDARGKVVAVTFVYTKCPDVCPLFTARFASIQRALDQRRTDSKQKNGHKDVDYLLLTVTTDPEYDTPAQLKSYAEHFKPNFNTWRFLTGPQKDLASLWKEFGVNVRKSADGHVQHTALTTLIDRRGIRRVEYYGDKWQEKEFLNDLLSLAERDQLAD
jgi:protein SCO1/2